MITRKIKDISGQRFGMVVALEFSYIHKDYGAMWKCRCDCGKEYITNGSRLRFHKDVSCGCRRHENVVKARQMPDGYSALTSIYCGYRLDADRHKKGLFNLSRDEFAHLVSLDCFYCGAKPVARKIPSAKTPVFCNGIDRVDSSRGYEINNVVPCCKTCNYAKNNMSYLDFKDWVHRIADHMLSKEMLYANG